MVKAETSFFNLFDIQVVQNSITKEFGAITNCAGNELDMSVGGVASAIKKDGGNQIESQCKLWVKSHGKVPTGCSTVTEAGHLNCSYVIHTIGPEYSIGDRMLAIDLLSSCIINTLEMAKIINVDSVSIPAISSGVLGFPKEECAEIMIRRVA